VFGIDSEKLIILAIITAVVLGPKRLPEYARKLAEWVRKFRAFADNAQAQLSEEIGEEVDWRKLDPRQYDPRRIIREALTEPIGPDGTVQRGHTAAVAEMERAEGAPAATGPAGNATKRIETLAAGENAPFDSEAT
jgi:sec-independent protein translocase protein TatB